MHIAYIFRNMVFISNLLSFATENVFMYNRAFVYDRSKIWYLSSLIAPLDARLHCARNHSLDIHINIDKITHMKRDASATKSFIRRNEVEQTKYIHKMNEVVALPPRRPYHPVWTSDLIFCAAVVAAVWPLKYCKR